MECDDIMKDKDKNKKSSGNCMLSFMCLGMSLGAAIGVATNNLSVYMALGMSCGLCIGSLIDASNRKKAKDQTEGDSDETK